MRIIRNPVELEENICIASSEAISIFSDAKGEVIYLGERDCSVQKNYQELLEESPSSGISSSSCPKRRNSSSAIVQRKSGKSAM